MKKIYFFLLIFLSFSVSVYSALDDDLLYVNTFNEGDCDTNEIGADGTTYGAAYVSNGGINGSSCLFDGTNDYVDTDDVIGHSVMVGNTTVSVWINTTTSGDDTYFAGGDKTSGNEEYCRTFLTGNILTWQCYERSGGVNQNIADVDINESTQWYNLIMTFDEDGRVWAWRDGVYIGSATALNLGIEGTSYFWIGAVSWSGSPTSYGAGYIDELYVWNRSLTNIEIGNLSSGVFYPFPTPIGGTTPSLSINTSLVNNTINYNLPEINVSVNGTIVNNSDIYTCNLWDDDTLLAINTSMNLSETHILNYTFGDVERDFFFWVNCSNVNASDSTGMYTYSVDTLQPRINITTDFINNTNYSQDDDLTWNITFIDQNLLAYEIMVFDDNLNLWDNQNYTALNVSGATNITNVTTFTLTDIGNFSINISAWDSHTNNKVKPIKWYYQTDTIIIDDEIRIIGDIKESKTEFLISPESDKYKFKITWEEDNYIHNFTLLTNHEILYLPKSSYLGHFVYFPKKRWIDLENDNIKNLVVEQKSYNEFFIQIELYTESDEVEFESIGDLNHINQVYYYQVLPVPSEEVVLLRELVEIGRSIEGGINLIAYTALLIFGYLGLIFKRTEDVIIIACMITFVILMFLFNGLSNTGLMWISVLGFILGGFELYATDEE